MIRSGQRARNVSENSVAAAYEVTAENYNESATNVGDVILTNILGDTSRDIKVRKVGVGIPPRIAGDVNGFDVMEFTSGDTIVNIDDLTLFDYGSGNQAITVLAVVKITDEAENSTFLSHNGQGTFPPEGNLQMDYTRSIDGMNPRKQTMRYADNTLIVSANIIDTSNYTAIAYRIQMDRNDFASFNENLDANGLELALTDSNAQNDPTVILLGGVNLNANGLPANDFPVGAFNLASMTIWNGYLSDEMINTALAAEVAHYGILDVAPVFDGDLSVTPVVENNLIGDVRREVFVDPVSLPTVHCRVIETGTSPSPGDNEEIKGWTEMTGIDGDKRFVDLDIPANRPSSGNSWVANRYRMQYSTDGGSTVAFEPNEDFAVGIQWAFWGQSIIDQLFLNTDSGSDPQNVFVSACFSGLSFAGFTDNMKIGWTSTYTGSGARRMANILQEDTDLYVGFMNACSSGLPLDIRTPDETTAVNRLQENTWSQSVAFSADHAFSKTGPNVYLVDDGQDEILNASPSSYFDTYVNTKFPIWLAQMIDRTGGDLNATTRLLRCPTYQMSQAAGLSVADRITLAGLQQTQEIDFYTLAEYGGATYDSINIADDVHPNEASNQRNAERFAQQYLFHAGFSLVSAEGPLASSILINSNQIVVGFKDIDGNDVDMSKTGTGTITGFEAEQSSGNPLVVTDAQVGVNTSTILLSLDEVIDSTVTIFFQRGVFIPDDNTRQTFAGVDLTDAGRSFTVPIQTFAMSGFTTTPLNLTNNLDSNFFRQFATV